MSGENGPIIPLLNDEILEEYQEVLLRNKFGFDSSDVDAYLITGNKKHYPIKSYVVTAREMLDIIGED